MEGEINVGKDVGDFLVVPEKGQIVVAKRTNKTLEVWERSPADLNVPLEAWKKVATTKLNESPGRIVRAGNGYYITFPDSQALVRVDPLSGKLGPKVVLPKGPYKIASWQDFCAVAVTCAGSGEVVIIDLQKMQMVSRQKLPSTPAMIAADVQCPGVVHLGYDYRAFTSMIVFKASGAVVTWRETAHKINKNYCWIHAYAGYLYVAPVGEESFIEIDLVTGKKSCREIKNLILLNKGENLQYLAIGPCGDHMLLIYYSRGFKGTAPQHRNRYFLGILNLTTQRLSIMELVRRPAKNIQMASSRQSFNGELYFALDQSAGIIYVLTAYYDN